ncbi:MAG: glycosyltransferase family 2 protein [Chitinophagales bacterium]
MKCRAGKKHYIVSSAAMEKKISILMPVKNAMPYLSECLTSIIHQTYTNWELIAVNDHSSDDSHATLLQFADGDERIKVLNNEGAGIIDALRLAYNYSNGDLITRMDADDTMAKHKLAVLQEALIHKGNRHIAIGKVQYFSDDDLGEGYKKYEDWLNSLTERGDNFKDIYKECVIPSPCWMVHREDLDQCGGFDHDTYPEDYDLCFRFHEQDLTCIPSDEVLHFWRDHASRSSRVSEHYADNRFLELKCRYFLKLHHQPNRPLVLWGAGKKGKRIAQFLIDHNIHFHWLCNNSNKIGKDIYGITLASTELWHQLHTPQIIIAVANPKEQNELHEQLQLQQLQSIEDYFFFC